MDDRRTIKSGPPRPLSEELDGLAPTLIAAPVAGARYRLERVVGRGTLFVTFRATRIDELGAVPHAVKVLRPSLERAWPAGARLLSNEQARVLAIVNERVPPSPHVVRLLEVGELAVDLARGIDAPTPFLAFEWIDDDDGAPSLLARVRERLASTGAALSPREVLRVLDGVVRGLDWVHQHGLLHRGLSASNVLVTGHDGSLIAKITDTAIARPRGLPETFGMQKASTAVAFDEPYRAPEQRDARATLTPACDVYALGALLRFVVAGRIDEQSLAAATTLHPGFAMREALVELDRALAAMRAPSPDARPPTALSAWEMVWPVLRALAARTKTSSRGATGRRSLAPSEASALIYTERHRPAVPRRLRSITVDAEGHALATDGATLAYFDGRRYREVDAPELTRVDVVATISVGSFLVGGRTRASGARLLRVSCEGVRSLPLDASGTVLAAAMDDDDWIAIVGADRGGVFAIDARGRVLVDGAIRASFVGRFGDQQWLICAEGDAALAATFDARSRVLRPHAMPIRRAPTAVAISGAISGEGAFLGGHHGVLVTARRTLDGPRLAMIREQLPTTATPTAIATASDGALWIAAGNELFVRETNGRFRSAFREDGVVDLLALAPGRKRMLGFFADGRVLEGRTLAE